MSENFSFSVVNEMINNKDFFSIFFFIFTFMRVNGEFYIGKINEEKIFVKPPSYLEYEDDFANFEKWRYLCYKFKFALEALKYLFSHPQTLQKIYRRVEQSRSRPSNSSRVQRKMLPTDEGFIERTSIKPFNSEGSFKVR